MNQSSADFQPKKGKLIIFSAPSGAGKSTIVQALLKTNLNLEFSISATSRMPRGEEKNGVDYYFLTPDEFRKRIDKDEFVEWEEVYTNTYYGTLKSEVERITNLGKNIVFDVDVVGGINIKHLYRDKAICLFIQPPSVAELEKRLIGRGTDSAEKIIQRIAKAEHELTFATKFDKIIVNNQLDQAISEAFNTIHQFIATN